MNKFFYFLIGCGFLSSPAYAESIKDSLNGRLNSLSIFMALQQILME
jgi:hypothetical protein